MPLESRGGLVAVSWWSRGIGNTEPKKLNNITDLKGCLIIDIDLWTSFVILSIIN